MADQPDPLRRPAQFPRRPDIAPHNLPESLTSFIGRERELTSIAQALEDHRLVTLVGPGGVGKSRLATEAGLRLQGRFADGIWLVDLGAVQDLAVVPHRVASVLEVAQGGRPSPTEALQQALAPRSLLIVLDNCEHLIDACAELAHALISVCPRLRMLTTSQEPLRVDGERLIPVSPLAVPQINDDNLTHLAASESVQLLVDRARAVQPDFALRPEIATFVAEICRRLDGIPLSLELGAARLHTMTPRELALGLEERFELLSAGARSAPARHQTLRQMVEWSAALLDPKSAVVLRRLAVFAGGWTRAAAGQVCQSEDLPPGTVARSLDSLVGRSLVVMDDWHGFARYRLLETIRAYAQEQLVEAGEAPTIRQRHFEHVLDLLNAAGTDIAQDQHGWLLRMDAEIDNVRGAFEWATRDPEHAERLLYASVGYWMYLEIRGRTAELIGQYERLLAMLPTDVYSPARLIGECHLCHSLGAQGQFPKAISIISGTVSHASSVTDPWARFWSALLQVQWMFVTGNAQMVALARQLVASGLESARPMTVGVPGWFLGEALLAVGQPEEAESELTRALHALRMPRERAMVTRSLGLLAYRTGQVDLAEQRIQAAFQGFLPFDDIHNLAICVEELASVAAAREQWERAAHLLGAAEGLFRQVGTAATPPYQLDPATVQAQTRAALGDAAFERELVRGRALARDELIATVLVTEPLEASSVSEPKAGPLTAREYEVALCIAEGASNGEIARRLVISRKTVETHVAHALTKLGLRSRASLAVWAAGRTDR